MWRSEHVLGASALVIAAVGASVLAFGAWLVGMLALVVVSRAGFDDRHPRMARRLDRAVWISWIGGTAVLFGPALGLTLAALFAESG
jgi:hypothetical protein